MPARAPIPTRARRPSNCFAALPISALSRLALALIVSVGLCPAAILQGVVLDNRTGQPLARARVAIEGSGLAAGGHSVFAGPSGQFSFPSLSAGAYTLSAQKPGYAAAKYGQKDWRSPGTPIVLEKEGSYSAILRLRKLGVVAGEVLDENRVAMPAVMVYAYRAGAAGRLDLKGVSSTDDSGAFRIAGLEPGRYYVRTGARLLEDRSGLLPTFLGQTAKPAEARVVNVNLEEETAGLSIIPLPGILSTLSGTVAGGAGATVTLFADTGKREARADPTGGFQFDQLPPGRYDLLAEAGSGNQMLAAWQQVAVTKESEAVTLEMAPAPVIQVTCQEKQGRPLEVGSVSVFVRRREPPEETPRRTLCGRRMRLSPGVWDLAAAAPTNLYVESVRAGRQAKQSHELELRAGQTADVLLTFSSSPATLKGKVATGDGAPAFGAPVYLHALDPELGSRMGGVRSARSDAKGEFVFPGLPPGRYEVVSSFAAPDTDEEDWAPGRGRTVELKEGEEGEIELILRESP